MNIRSKFALIMAVMVTVVVLTAVCIAQPTPEIGWDDRFGHDPFGDPGADDYVFHIKRIDGDVYATGTFATIGGVVTHGVARWDGSAWHPIGEGFTGNDNPPSHGRAIVRWRDLIVVGGRFTEIDGQPAQHLAAWDGVSWTELGGGVSDGGQFEGVQALAVDGDDLLVGGTFLTAGSVPVNHVARWDGENWTPLAAGVSENCGPNSVRTLCLAPEGVYAGGCFRVAGAVEVNHVALWDGSQWNALGSPVPGVGGGLVHDMELGPAGLYAAGGFQASGGGTGGQGISIWDGSQWQPATDPQIHTESFTPVEDILLSGSFIYAGGDFRYTTDFQDLSGIACWDGERWLDLDGGLRSESGYYRNAYALEEQDGVIFVGGNFQTAGGIVSNNIARLAEGGWLTRSVNGRVRAVAHHGGQAILGGDFTRAGDEPAGHVVLWNGSTWQTLGAGLDGTVHALVSLGGDLYAGGEFASADGTPAANLARWDGATWIEVGGGVNGPVQALTTDGTHLFVGGEFYLVGGQVAINLAIWNGSTWEGTGQTPNGPVHALAALGDDLYVGGDFVRVGPQITPNVARWSGAGWDALDTGLNAPVQALTVHAGEVYAGGEFVTISGQGPDHVARWDGQTWQGLPHALGNGVDGAVRALASANGRLYLAGEFSEAGPTPLTRIGSWDGVEWRALGDGLNASADAVAALDTEILVGGEFTFAGGMESYKFGRYIDSAPVDVESLPSAGTLLHPAYPNPFNPRTVIAYELPAPASVSLSIHDLRGRSIRSLVSGAREAGNHEVVWNGRDHGGRPCPAGSYVARLVTPWGASTRKLMLAR